MKAKHLTLYIKKYLLDCSCKIYYAWNCLKKKKEKIKKCPLYSYPHIRISCGEAADNKPCFLQWTTTVLLEVLGVLIDSSPCQQHTLVPSDSLPWQLGCIAPCYAFSFLFTFAYICLFCECLFSIEHVTYFFFVHMIYVYFLYESCYDSLIDLLLTCYDSYLTHTLSSLWLVLPDDSYFTMTRMSLWLIC